MRMVATYNLLYFVGKWTKSHINHNVFSGLCMCSILLPPRMKRISEDEGWQVFIWFQLPFMHCFLFKKINIVYCFLLFKFLHNVLYCSSAFNTTWFLNLCCKDNCQNTGMPLHTTLWSQLLSEVQRTKFFSSFNNCNF